MVETMNVAKRKRPIAQDMARMLHNGLSPEHFIKLLNATELDCFTLERIEDGEDFVTAAFRLAAEAEAYAKEQEALGHRTTASLYYQNASHLYRMGDYGLIEITDEKLEHYRKLVETYRIGKQLATDESVECVEIPFEGKTLPGYLVLPDNPPDKVPVTIVIAGATGYKEENYAHLKYVVERGMAALVYDGPGQGEALLMRDVHYTVDNFERSVQAAIDWLRGDSRFGDRIALYGVSYGGYLAPRAACFMSDQLVACIARGGCAKTDDLTLPRDGYYLQKFKPKFGVTDDETAAAISTQMNIEPYLHQLTCSLLVQHTEQDPVVGTDGAHKIYELSSSADKEYFEIPGFYHCGVNEDKRVGSYAADWLADRLLERA
jgi:alpha-beta hydrolase superfamily lysophospholipase